MRQMYSSEERYITLEEIREDAADLCDLDNPTDEDCQRYIKLKGLEPVEKCSLCERTLPEDRELPICLRCEGTARAHARLEQNRIEEERDL